MKEQTFNRSVDAHVPATEPHFDDELTLMSARPVVPLEKISAKERNRRHWLLGGAFALAMILGAASALVASYLKLRNVPNTPTEISEIETSIEPVAAAAEPVASELPVTEETPQSESIIEEEGDTAVTSRRAPVRRRVRVSPTTELVRPRTVTGLDEDEALDVIRESILVDEWQERRARRAARRERERNRLDHHDRDLSNLDEIFEGRRRRRP